MSNRHTGAVGAVAVSIGVLAALGCGGGSSDQTQANDWASSVCQAVVTWQGELREVASDLKSETPTKQDPQQAAAKAERATTTMVSSLEDVGKPAGADAQTAQKELTKLSNQLRDDKQTIAAAISGVSGVQGLVEAISTVTT